MAEDNGILQIALRVDELIRQYGIEHFRSHAVHWCDAQSESIENHRKLVTQRIEYAVAHPASKDDPIADVIDASPIDGGERVELRSRLPVELKVRRRPVSSVILPPSGRTLTLHERYVGLCAVRESQVGGERICPSNYLSDSTLKWGPFCRMTNCVAHLQESERQTLRHWCDDIERDLIERFPSLAGQERSRFQEPIVCIPDRDRKSEVDAISAAIATNVTLIRYGHLPDEASATREVLSEVAALIPNDWGRAVAESLSRQGVGGDAGDVDASRLGKERNGSDGAEATPSSGWIKVREAARVAAVDAGVISRAIDFGSLKGNGKRNRERRVDAADLVRWQRDRARRPEIGESDEVVGRKLRNLMK